MNTISKITPLVDYPQGKFSPQSPEADPVSDVQFLEDIVAMIQALQNFLLSCVETNNKMQESTSDIGKKMTEQLEQQYLDICEKIRKAEKEKHRFGIFSKIFNAIGAALGIIVSCVIGQPEIAAAILATTVLQASGAMDKIVSGISSLLQKIGLPPEISELLAKVLLIVVAIVATAGAGGIGAAEEEGVEEGATLAEPKEEASLNWKSGSLIGLQMTATLDPIADLVMAMPGDKEKKEMAALILGIIEGLICTLVTLKIGAGSSSAATGEEIVKNLMQKLQDAARKMQLLLSGVRTGTAVGMATFAAEQGEYTKQLASSSRDQVLLQGAVKMNRSLTDTFSQNTKEISDHYRGIGDSSVYFLPILVEASLLG